jgi:hypothetical protein
MAAGVAPAVGNRVGASHANTKAAIALSETPATAARAAAALSEAADRAAATAAGALMPTRLPAQCIEGKRNPATGVLRMAAELGYPAELAVKEVVRREWRAWFTTRTRAKLHTEFADLQCVT